MHKSSKEQRPFSRRWVERVLTVAAAGLLRTYAILLDSSDPPVRPSAQYQFAGEPAGHSCCLQLY